MDLFGDTTTQPQCAGLKRRLFNAAHGFPEFWKAWPSHPRKVAKQKCLDQWARFECAEMASHIVAHVEYLKTTQDWLEGRIPMPATYLNQKRWDGWEPEPERPKKPDALAEIKAHKGAPIPPEVRAKMAALKGK
jgi:hypothetical protein